MIPGHALGFHPVWLENGQAHPILRRKLEGALTTTLSWPCAVRGSTVQPEAPRLPSCAPAAFSTHSRDGRTAHRLILLLTAAVWRQSAGNLARDGLNRQTFKSRHLHSTTPYQPGRPGTRVLGHCSTPASIDAPGIVRLHRDSELRGCDLKRMRRGASHPVDHV